MVIFVGGLYYRDAMIASTNYELCTMNCNKGRFAPSPTGRMHLGNLFCALLSWLSVKSKGGEWLLRIEDLDPGRSRPEYARWVMDDLNWLGLTWDGEPVYQSHRSDIYEHYFRQLQQRGMTYPCYCTRADLLATQAPHESDGRVVYKGTCRGLPPQPGRRGATRLIVPDRDLLCTDGHYGEYRVNLSQQVGDFIIRRNHTSSIFPCSATPMDSGCQSVTRVLTWNVCDSIAQPAKSSAGWLFWLASSPRPMPSAPRNSSPCSPGSVFPKKTSSSPRAQTARMGTGYRSIHELRTSARDDAVALLILLMKSCASFSS